MKYIHTVLFSSTEQAYNRIINQNLNLNCKKKKLINEHSIHTSQLLIKFEQINVGMVWFWSRMLDSILPTIVGNLMEMRSVNKNPVTEVIKNFTILDLSHRLGII